MCGIAGAVGSGPRRLEAVRALAARLVHRGPDDYGEFDDSDCSLAIRRLSIIDIAGGHQPLFNEDKRIVSVCNGELYNFQDLRRRLEVKGHTFRTRSDVEIVGHGYEEWGDAFLDEINGMFAVALWDARRRRLLLARDRVGKKPLYYARRERGLLFSSELRSLLAFPGGAWDVDTDACRAFLALGHMPSDRTPIEGIRRLPPGHSLVWEQGDISVRPYWAAAAADPPRTIAEADLALRDLLASAVSLRLISDVPVGAFLSGGLDSSIVVAMAARELGARVPTFSISFPGYADYDEASYAKEVATYCGCEHEQIDVDPSGFLEVGETMWDLDEPLSDPAALPTLLLSKGAKRRVTVALTGEGADEVFGGYDRYWLSLRGARFAARLPGLGALAGAGLALLGLRGASDGRAARTLRAAAEGAADAVAWSRSLASAAAVGRVAGWSKGTAAEPAHLGAPFNGAALQAIQHDDLATHLANGLLVKVDRMTMATSLEARCPYLDYRVVEFGLGLPEAWKIRGRESKVLLRRLGASLLPAGIAARHKHTFRVPLGEWLRGPLRGFLDELLTSEALADLGIVDKTVVSRLVLWHLRGRADFSRALWALVTLERWFQRAAAVARVRGSRAGAPAA